MGFKAKYEEKVYGITTTLDFGKYKGYTVGNILELDPEYILWASQYVSQFKMTKSVKSVLFQSTSDVGFDPVWDIYMK